MDFSDIFNSDGSGGLPDWLTEGAAIYQTITGGGGGDGGGQQPTPVVQTNPAAMVSSMGSSAAWIIAALVLGALVFGVKGRG